jgi:hypothetical protein
MSILWRKLPAEKALVVASTRSKETIHTHGLNLYFCGFKVGVIPTARATDNKDPRECAQ